MTETEKRLREAMVQRLLDHYPPSGKDFKDFLSGKKVTIDSWLGDVFPQVLVSCFLSGEYDEWRAVLFVD